MGDPISVVFPDTYVSKIEEEIVALMNPHFYKRYVDETYIRRKKNEQDCRFQKLNSSHPNIKLTIGKISIEFLDTEIIRRGCGIEQKFAISQKSF